MPWKLKSPPTTPRGAGTEPSTSTPSTKPANEKKGSSKNAEQKDEGREVVLGSKEDGERHGDEQVCEEGEKPKETVTRKKKKPKQPVIDLVKDLGIEDNRGEDEHANLGKPRRRFASAKELKKASFYEDLLRGELGLRRAGKAEFNRVIYVLGDRSDTSLSAKEWKACAQGILRASDHTDALVLETASSKSVLGCVRKDLLKLGKTAAVDAFDASASDSSAASPFHKATVVLTDVSGKDNESFVRAKQDLAQGLAGGYKVVALWIGRPEKEQLEKFQAELSGIKERQWPLLTLHHIDERDVETGEKICKYPKANITSAELASFIHVHLTVDIFNM